MDYLVLQMFMMNFQFVSKVYMIGTWSVLQSKKAEALELFNESFIMLIMYHMICFTDVIPHQETRDYIGKSCMICISLHIIGNLLVMSAESLKQIKRNWKKKQHQ